MPRTKLDKNNENRNSLEIDWSKPRKNINPKTKNPYKRGRNWAVIVYPDSAPKDWEDIIKQEPVAISPLHDKDVNADGERKKAHYHLVFAYKGYKSFEQIDELARLLHAPIPERINSLTGATRYLIHYDNPEKFQYSSSEIRTYGGFDLESIMSFSTGDKRQILRDMMDYIISENIIHLADFVKYCMSENAPSGWFEILTERNTLIIKELIKSNWQKSRAERID